MTLNELIEGLEEIRQYSGAGECDVYIHTDNSYDWKKVDDNFIEEHCHVEYDDYYGPYAFVIV